MQNLSVGRSDPWVHILQKHLQTTQHLQAPFSQGTFDENTKQAVCALQLEYGIV
jgi:peptidoglycan hydrolase-like protein with peptidoglycan-binding domain